MVKSIPKIKFFEDLLLSKFVTKEKLLALVELGNISRKQFETKKSLVIKLTYESVYGLDEILNILFTEDELKNICSTLKLELTRQNKKNLISLLIKSLPTEKERKLETVIDEGIEFTGRLIIYNLFIIYKNGTCLFSYNLEPLDIGSSSLITSALNAIEGLIQEITQTNSRLESIDIKEKELIFEYKGDIIGVLLLNKETKEARAILRTFLTQFIERYEKNLFPYDGNTATFDNAIDLIEKNFASYFI